MADITVTPEQAEQAGRDYRVARRNTELDPDYVEAMAKSLEAGVVGWNRENDTFQTGE